MATRRGIDGNDVLTGTDEREHLYGLGGADVLEGARALTSSTAGRARILYEAG